MIGHHEWVSTVIFRHFDSLRLHFIKKEEEISDIVCAMEVVRLYLVVNRTLLRLFVLELLNKRTVFVAALELASSEYCIDFLGLLDGRTKESFQKTQKLTPSITASIWDLSCAKLLLVKYSKLRF